MSVDLMENVKEIPPVKEAAAEEYAAKLDAMVEKVNKEMASHPHIHELIGGNPFRTMYDNHRNHAMILSNVLRLSEFRVLAAILPWVYRTYMGHGFQPNYFPEVLNIWKKVIYETMAAENAADIAAVYDWIISLHEDLLEKSSQGPLYIAGQKNGEVVDQFVPLLLKGEHRRCLVLAHERVKTTADLETFYIKVLQPALYRIGEMWETREVSVAEEHLATATVGRIMAALYSLVLGAEKNKGLAVVTAAANEYHETGARMVSDFLESDGWDVAYLGSNVPVEEMVGFVKDNHPFLLAVSVAMPFNLFPAKQAIARIKNDPALAGLKIMVGGLAYNYIPDALELMGAPTVLQRTPETPASWPVIGGRSGCHEL